ncbi:MAG: MerR family transcriptional regulator [Vallitalea sp.]|jgi:effector-binding domain-containing protein|nr:MerR family transcriptional regulator [Vallitalea sp.]
MKNRFLISEISKMHNIPTKTLRYYHEIGLFEPFEIDEKTGYRYYCTEQFEELNTINYLKYLGIPLKDIKKHLENKDIDSFINLLITQKEITKQKIKELEVIKNRFDSRINEIQKAKEIKDIEIVKIKKLPKRKMISLEEKISSVPQLELSLRKLENKYEISSNIIIGKVVLTVAREDILNLQVQEYNSINIIIEDNICDEKDIKILEEGQYACIYYRGDHSISKKYYQMLLEFIEDNNYNISGDSYERTIVNEYISNKQEDYLTEIQIPII